MHVLRRAGCGVACGALLLGLILTDQAQADKKPVPAQKQPPGPDQHAQRESIAQELYKVRVLLEHADHDYKGHRHAAVKEIGHAIGDLWPKNPYKDWDKPIKRERQRLSDAQLREALGLLHQMHDTLKGMPGKVPAKAAEHVHKAHHEVEVALTVR
jgi:hypothetical protein